ncbi:MAG TPA: DinB family protein [Terriglobia bacterium]|nr:DinB family protein [Terriglobia bacterium]
MMRRRVVGCLLVFIVGMAGAEALQADCGVAEALKIHWARTRKKITDIVAAMPEDKWDFRPVKEVRSFREMAVHLIQDGITHTAWITGMTREDAEKIAAKYEHYKTREEILRGLGEMFDIGERYISTITDQNMNDLIVGMRSEPMTRIEAALVAMDDQTDHYGNMVVYLRLNGVVPPATANAAKEREENLRKLKQLGLEPGSSLPATSGEHAH